MEVRAIKRGFDGRKLRCNDNETPEVFDFEGFRINEDGSNNLGSWMELTENGEKELAKLMKAHKSAKTKKANKEKTQSKDES